MSDVYSKKLEYQKLWTNLVVYNAVSRGVWNIEGRYVLHAFTTGEKNQLARWVQMGYIIVVKNPSLTGSMFVINLTEKVIDLLVLAGL